MRLNELTIKQAGDGLKKKEFSSVEITKACFEQIEKTDDKIKSFITLTKDLALKQAKEADQAGDFSRPLAGVPAAIKDCFCTKGVKTTAASKILENYVPPFSATSVEKLEANNYVMLGKVNLDEFTMGSSTENSGFFPTKNPWDLSRVPGGSSGGSAAAVAADQCLYALGTDTCGSVRQPSSFCGLVGLKPTYGALSRHGIIAMGNSLDQVSPFGKNVRDAEIIFQALSKHDPEDATSAPENLRNLEPRNYNLEPKRIGVPWHLFAEGVDETVMANFKESMLGFEKAGYEIIDIKLPYSKYSLPAYYIIMPAEVSTNLARFDGIRYGYSDQSGDLMSVYTKSRGVGFGREARRRILLGTYVLSHGYYDAYYNKAVKVREKIGAELAEAFKKVSLIATPTTPTPAFSLGEKLDDPVAMYLCDVFSAPANLAGIPSLALPSGKTPEGLPLSLQFMAPHFAEERLFSAGKDFESLREDSNDVV